MTRKQYSLEKDEQNILDDFMQEKLISIPNAKKEIFIAKRAAKKYLKQKELISKIK